MIDYHIHPDYSIDAKGRPETYIQKALDMGLKEICFTTHIDLCPKSKFYAIKVNKKIQPPTIDNVGFYVDEINSLKEKYSKQNIKIKLGAEFDYYKKHENEIIKIADSFDFDYLLVGVHVVNGIAIDVLPDAEQYFSNRSLEIVLTEYFDVVKSLIKMKLFNCIAHLDIYKRFGYRFFGDKILTEYKSHITEVFELMNKNNIGLEINTSALRKGFDECYPSNKMLTDAFNSGINIITVGSDCHQVEDLGYQINTAITTMKNIGWCNIATFTKRKLELIKL